MEFTCLSKGRGFQFPPCHILEFCGIRILLDCPLDLSALMAFSPVPSAFDALSHGVSYSTTVNAINNLRDGSLKKHKTEKSHDEKSLIFAAPWYKTVEKLHLWNASFIDVVLISSPMGILGLPFLTRMKGFSAKIYMTEASARLGELMMQDLVSMQEEFRKFYGPEEFSFPPWLRQEEVESLPPILKEILLGKDGVELNGWMPLYSAVDVKNCVRRIHTLKYAEEACFNGTLVIKAFSSGIEIGSCNWILNSPMGDIAHLSRSSFISSHAMTFDYRSLKGKNALIYSDFASLSDAQDVQDGENHSIQPSDKLLPVNFDDNTGENLEEKEKIAFISSCAISCVKEGGSVLIPINRLGTSLQLLEELTQSLDSSAIKVPVYIISSVAQELLSFLDIIPEWVCKQRQEKLFVGEPLFAHGKLLKEKRIHVIPSIDSISFLTNFQEPCIVFGPHWSLRLGPIAGLLCRWCRDPKSLLILEDVLNPELALLPFMPVAMKVLQCLFPSEIGLEKIQHLLQTLQPQTVLFPEDLRKHISFLTEKSYTIIPYIEGQTSKLSCEKDNLEMKIAKDLGLTTQFYWTIVTRLNGKLLVENAGCYLFYDDGNQSSSESRHLVTNEGLPDLQKLVTILSEMGITASVHRKNNTQTKSPMFVVRTQDPYKASIEIGKPSIVINTNEDNVAQVIFKAVSKILDGA